MWKDTIVMEIRKLREEHAAQFNYNIKDIVDSLKQQEQESGRTVVSFACFSEDNPPEQNPKT